MWVNMEKRVQKSGRVSHPEKDAYGVGTRLGLRC